MKAIAIDTTNLVMGVAIVDGEKVVGEMITNLKKNHSVRLMPAISQLMNEVGFKPSDLQRVIVAHGPGSYTGVRIGVTTAKTLAWTLNIPIVGVSSLEVLAQNGRFFNGYICPFFDARRGQVYTGLYKAVHQDVQVQEEDRLVLLKDWLETLKNLQERILFLSNDLALHEEAIKAALGNRAVFPYVSMQNPRPSELALLGLTKEPQPNTHEMVPQYLQLAEAEVKWLEAQNKGEIK
ncbi:tRNA (adenosine(37)-N6)-threonylcarbamoyltransferase complex dimerization subunit type 1 TsaB [Alkalihalophilus pseudofirmus]|uniref:tRNA (adenosine(37)-N6)-threonylcarbamoyltransferase complex dimerization subunit type 1 TsaB n=1 Tax=Alkalihalobacterium alkalinitrilicum TaxID=427920 RepID=UPI00094BF169|nr:tRNA (adenosine(37)-N6)-threonylcarbamoyltransferase complex dimerization subunit type 1 TsaB [Alkalihalobacterium alkalinitrilicum]OLO26708.1 tRNA (adenosine(37)-N6)-threonylcarbamoyltransferase complex dimerization subunit type 1 TsaB [Alkalihalophilus pseudofirmus]